MLVPLTRKTFEEVIPAVASSPQYVYCWGKLKDLLRRILISVVGMFAILILYLVLDHAFPEVFLVVGISTGLYWLWEPVLRASLRNIEYRRYGYAGFWRGQVTDVFVSEELVGTEETVNNRGELVIVENRERCLTLEVGDRDGFYTRLQVPLKRAHRALDIGDVAEMVVFSSRSDLGRIETTSDIYIPDHNLWVSDYPYLQRDTFIEVSRRLNASYQDQGDWDRGYPDDQETSEPMSRRKRIPRTRQKETLSRSDETDAIDEYAPRDRRRQVEPDDEYASRNRSRRKSDDLDRPRRSQRQDRMGDGSRPPRPSRRRPRTGYSSK